MGWRKVWVDVDPTGDVIVKLPANATPEVPKALLGTPQGQLDNLRKAIEDKGPYPEFHNKVVRLHRAQWPALWRAIDALLAQG